MPTARDVAEWMLEEFKAKNALYQNVVVDVIAKKFGGEFVHTNQSGGVSINRAVLKAFRRLTEGDVVWDRGEKAWRRRESGESGRIAD